MKIYIETYGCQMNVSDSELVASILTHSGYEITKDIELSDVILFNTCSVREHAEDRVLGRISNELSRKKHNPNLKIGVLGCMAQRMGKRLIEEYSGIDYVVGVDQYAELPQILRTDSGHTLDFNVHELYNDITPIHANNKCGFVTISRGCDNYCTYCIVPHVRGRERSRPHQEILKEVRFAVSKGIKDITLLGQNVNSYSDGDISFPILLDMVNEIDDLFRIRFVTSHPKDLSLDLIMSMQKNHKVCEHIHLPLQSGSSEVLKRMNRQYSIVDYISKVESLRKTIPNVSITTDLIVGFPGETESQFKETLKVVQEVKFDYSFCFKYSPRSGTKAAEYVDQVEESIRLERLQILIDLQRDITLKKFKGMIGMPVEIYVESLSKKNSSHVSGKTRDNKVAVVSGDYSLIGTLVQAKVVGATAGTLICE